MADAANQDTRPILITGGTGFIASYLAMSILEDNEDEHVVLFDRNPDRDPQGRVARKLTGFKDRHEAVKDRITFVQGDLSEEKDVLAVFDNYPPARPPKSVYHLGALLSASAQANPTMGFEANIKGAWYVLEAARQYGEQNNADPTKAIKVLFASSIAAFGREHVPSNLINNIPNEFFQLPTTIYGDSKVSVERLGEYYHRQGWMDFRALRFPSVIGAGRGPGGTTIYSSLMIQQPAVGRPYTTYVDEDTGIAIIYVKDAVKALRMLHDAPNNALGSSGDGDPAHPTFRRVFNLGGIRTNSEDEFGNKLPPTAGEIRDAVVNAIPGATINFEPDQALINTVHGFGILDDSAARNEWGWTEDFPTIDEAVEDFVQEATDFPDRIQKNIELNIA